jgi:uncharacterized GH25 family protein
MKRVALATVILSAIALTIRAQPPRDHPSASEPTTRTLSGRVIADETGDPIANARVSLLTTGQGVPVVLTNHDGRFTLAAPPTRLIVAASKSGYGRREAAVAITESSVEIRLSRGAAISGRVVDEFGDPIWQARVLIEKAAAPSNANVNASEASTETDDRGEYRLGSLPSGTFRVATVTIGPMTQQAIASGQVIIGGRSEKTYYPAVKASADAETLRLHPGDERAAIDFVIPGAQTAQGNFTFIGPLDDPDATAPLHTGVIRGRVVSTDGRGLSHAQVRALPRFPASTPPGTGQAQAFQPTVVTTDTEGRFELLALAAGTFRVSAGKVGYSAPDASFPLGFSGPGILIDLAEGETKERVDITLARWGAVLGHVFDELGDPLQGASVQLLQVRYQAGKRRLVAAGGTSLPTDDLGRFRVSGLPPGQYIVSASVGGVASADLPGYGRSFFPGTPNASEAQFVSMKLSQETSGIDFALSRAPTARIAGTMVNAAGEPSTGGSVRLMPSLSSTTVTTVPVGARILPDGRFEFPNVTPGQYIIQVDRGRKNSSTEGEFGVLPVAVEDRDVTGLLVQTSSGSSIAGNVMFDSALGAKAPQPDQIEITPVPIDPERAPMAPANADIRRDWSFVINGINGPRRLQLRRAPGGWTLKEIRIRGVDVTDRPLMFGTTDQSLAEVEVVLTDRINQVSGSVADDHAKPAPGSPLVVFSTDRDRWYPSSRFLRRATAGTDGAFRLAGLPPGSYYAAAVSRLPPDGEDAWQEPAYLESLVPRAANFSLSEGQQQVLQLKLP